jgi:SAM-dependent methyltransferase
LRSVAGAFGLMPLARWSRDLVSAARFRQANAAWLKANPGDPVPIPGARLRILVAGSPDIAWFVEGGRRGAASIRSILEDNGVRFATVRSLLDFGCGCGRVLRHFMADGVSIHGSDLNPKLIRWCDANLAPARFSVNGLAPPLAQADASVGLVYSLSVFTHLPENLQKPWLDELRRVLRPGGHLILSTHGERYREVLDESERSRFDRGLLVLRAEDRPGSNACGAYHPPSYLRSLVEPHFVVVAHRPEGALGNPHQDLWLLRKK